MWSTNASTNLLNSWLFVWENRLRSGLGYVILHGKSFFFSYKNMPFFVLIFFRPNVSFLRMFPSNVSFKCFHRIFPSNVSIECFYQMFLSNTFLSNFILLNAFHPNVLLSFGMKLNFFCCAIKKASPSTKHQFLMKKKILLAFHYSHFGFIMRYGFFVFFFCTTKYFEKWLRPGVDFISFRFILLTVNFHDLSQYKRVKISVHLL